MARFAVWLEGMDFSETLLDSQKLSVIRGASRALEALAPAAEEHFRKAGLRPETVASGAAMAGFIVTGEEDAVNAATQAFLARAASQGASHEEVKRRTEAVRRAAPATPAAQLRDMIISAAPFAHLRILHGMAPADGDEGAAVARARARLRRAQLSGRAVRPLAAGETMCEFDRSRAADPVPTEGPAKPGDDKSSLYDLSAASAARWQFGRLQRQLLYLDAGAGEMDFTDDFRELVATPPTMPDGKDLPVSARRKVAVFMADGDGFGSQVIPALEAALGGKAGNALALRVLAHSMRQFMNGLLATLVSDIRNLGEGPGLVRDQDRRSGQDVLRTRLETLLFGGDDVTFMVPAWLGLWLARRFFAISSGWQITPALAREALGSGTPVSDFAPVPLRFSAGLVFASEKCPIRSLRALAEELLYSAKQVGGIDIEFLESIEPPHGGLSDHRKWQTNSSNSELFAVSRDSFGRHIESLLDLWVRQRFPASQAYKALKAGDAARKAAAAGSQAEAERTADTAVIAEFTRYLGRADEQHQDLLRRFGFVEAGPGGQAMRLYRMLQHRDYVRAATVTGMGTANAR